MQATPKLSSAARKQRWDTLISELHAAKSVEASCGSTKPEETYTHRRLHSDSSSELSESVIFSFAATPIFREGSDLKRSSVGVLSASNSPLFRARTPSLDIPSLGELESSRPSSPKPEKAYTHRRLHSDSSSGLSDSVPAASPVFREGSDLKRSNVGAFSASNSPLFRARTPSSEIPSLELDSSRPSSSQSTELFTPSSSPPSESERQRQIVFPGLPQGALPLGSSKPAETAIQHIPRRISNPSTPTRPMQIPDLRSAPNQSKSIPSPPSAIGKPPTAPGLAGSPRGYAGAASPVAQARAEANTEAQLLGSRPGLEQVFGRPRSHSEGSLEPRQTPVNLAPVVAKMPSLRNVLTYFPSATGRP
jgi:hypothetical protein